MENNPFPSFRFAVIAVLFTLGVTDVLGQTADISPKPSVYEAELFMEKARAEKSFYPQIYLQSVLNLANVCYINQEYAQARMYFWEYMLQASAKGLFDFNDAQDIEVFKLIGLSSFYLGDYDESIDRFQDYLSLVQKIGNLYNQEIISYCWMTEDYIKKKDYSDAWLGVKKINELIAQYDIKDQYTILLSKYVEANLTTQTEPQKAIKMIANLPIEGIEDNMESYQLFSLIYYLYGTCAMLLDNLPLAAEMFQDGMKFMEETELNKGIDYYNSILNLMLTQSLQSFESENFDSLIPLASKLNIITLERIHDNFPKMTEEQRAAYWTSFSNWLNFYLPRLASTSGNPILLREAYSGLLITKGLLLRSSISLQNYVVHSGDEELMDIQDQIQYLKRKIQFWQNSCEEKSSQEIFNIQTNMNRLQQRVLKRVGNKDFMSDVYINVDSVRSNLHCGDVAIEIVALDRDIDGPDSTQIRVKEYLSLVLKPEYEYPHIVKLCDSRSLPKNRHDLSVLYNAVWKPLKEELNGIRRIFFSLDGELHKLPVEYCQSTTGKLMSELYEMYRLSSTRELALNKSNRRKGNDICLFGNVDYFQSQGYSAKPTSIDVTDNIEPLKKQDTYNRKRGASEVETMTFGDLLYSKQETYSVASICRENNMKTWLYERDNATEEMFKNMSGKSPQMLLLSTHGYYINNESKGENNIPTDKEDAENLSLEDEALSRSGLVLAGANLYLLKENDSKNKEDGFVTARELARMNLDNTDIVVLSACETGLGDISSEGVIGLQRGFKRAGVNSLVMSLWKVNDYVTAFFMEQFYKSYFESKSKQKAITNAISKLRSLEGSIWDKPEYWASFILLDGID